MKSRMLARQLLKEQWQEILNHHCAMDEKILQLCLDQVKYERYVKWLTRYIYVGFVLGLIIGGLLPWVYGINISDRMGVFLTMILIIIPLIAGGSLFHKIAENRTKIATYQAGRAEDFIEAKGLKEEFERWQSGQDEAGI